MAFIYKRWDLWNIYFLIAQFTTNYHLRNVHFLSVCVSVRVVDLASPGGGDPEELTCLEEVAGDAPG